MVVTFFDRGLCLSGLDNGLNTASNCGWDKVQFSARIGLNRHQGVGALHDRADKAADALALAITYFMVERIERRYDTVAS